MRQPLDLNENGGEIKMKVYAITISEYNLKVRKKELKS